MTQASDQASGLSQQLQQQKQQQQPPPTSRPAVAPGAGALVPRMSPVYHIGSLPTLFESPHASAEVRFLFYWQIVRRQWFSHSELTILIGHAECWC